MSGLSDQYPTGTSFYRDGVLYVAFHGCNVDTAEDFIRGVYDLVCAAQAIVDHGCPSHECDHLEDIEAIAEALRPFTRAASDDEGVR